MSKQRNLNVHLRMQKMQNSYQNLLNRRQTDDAMTKKKDKKANNSLQNTKENTLRVGQHERDQNFRGGGSQVLLQGKKILLNI